MTSSRKGTTLLKFAKGQHKGEVIPCAANVITILATDKDLAGALAFDDFEGSVVTLRELPWYDVDAPAKEKSRPGAWRDTDTTRLRAWIAREYDLIVSKTDTDEAINVASEGCIVHPVRDYLRALKWDGAPRLDRWLIDFASTEDTPFVRAVSAAWMISAVARVMQPGSGRNGAGGPGCKADCMLVLQGAQGVGKSTALASLVPHENWFFDSWDPESKDGRIAMLGTWIIEVGELAALKKSEVETIKSALSRRREKIRMPYGRRDGWYPRQCVLAGTTNVQEVLKDDTGNRRFWPVRVGEIDVQALRASRDQIWAEAVARYEKGEAWHLTDATIIAAAKEQQEARLIADPREDIVAQWLAGSRVDGRDESGTTKSTPRGRLGVTTKELLLGPLAMTPDRAGQAAQLEAARLIRKCGWATCGKKHTRGAARPRLFFPNESGCLACLERWDTAPQATAEPAPRKKKEKKTGQIGQIGHRAVITGKNGAQSDGGVLGGLGTQNGAAGAAPLASPASLASAQVMTAPPPARGRGHRKRIARGAS